MRTIRVISCIVVLCALHPVATLAETGGRLIGLVTDEKAAPIAGARITVTGRRTAGVQQVTTNADGVYKILGLPLRELLVVRAEAPGKMPIVYTGLLARAGFGTRRDFRLRPHDAHVALALLSPGWSYYRDLLEGARGMLRGEITVVELTGSTIKDTQIAREALKASPNAVLAVGRTAALLARRQIRDVPVVYAMVPDPIGDDLLAANLCGVALNGGFGEALDRLEGLVPRAHTVGTVFDPRRLARSVKELRGALAERGLKLEARPVRNAGDLEAAFRSLAEARIDAFFLLLDPDLLDPPTLERIGRFVTSRDIVYIVQDAGLLDLGGTFSFAPGFRQMGADAAGLANRIIASGVQPSRIGLGYPSERFFALNSSQAARLGITEIAADD